MTYMSPVEYAGWLADKIPAYGDYAKEAAILLVKQATRIAELEAEVKSAWNHAKAMAKIADRHEAELSAIKQQWPQGLGTPSARFTWLMDALEARFPHPNPLDSAKAPERYAIESIDNFISAIKQQEPVAWMDSEGEIWQLYSEAKHATLDEPRPLYLHPAPIPDNQQGSWLDELALKMAREVMSTTRLILRGGDTQMLARIQVLIRDGLEIVSTKPGEKP